MAQAEPRSLESVFPHAGDRDTIIWAVMIVSRVCISRKLKSEAALGYWQPLESMTSSSPQEGS